MNTLATGIKVFGILFILTGLIYPMTVMLVANTLFPYQARGSLITQENGGVTGSELIGQNFSLPRYFQSRPSATPGSPYNAASSAGSNLGPTNPHLMTLVAERIKTFNDSGISGPIPADLVTASASGLDPHLSLDAALFQVPVIANHRMISEKEIRDLVLAHTEQNPWPFAQPYVHLLSLNQALDEKFGETT